jgi:hypothetical protein
MINQLLQRYETGVITADELAVECLHMIDPANPGLVLSALPTLVLGRVRQLTVEWRKNGMVTNFGILPTEDQVAAAKQWIERPSPDIRERVT